MARALTIIEDEATWTIGAAPMGIVCTAKGRRTALHYAAWHRPRRLSEDSLLPEDQRWWRVRELLIERADAVVDTRDEKQATALTIACQHGNVGMAMRLLSLHANPNISVTSPGGYGHGGTIQRTIALLPLHFPASSRHCSIVVP